MRRRPNAKSAREGKRAKYHRLTLKSIVAVVGGMSVLYLMSILLEMPVELVSTLLLFSMVALVWMAIKILKDPWSTQKTFDEYFYQDSEIRRLKAE